MEEISPEMLVHIYDEIAESQVRLRSKDYEDFLCKWGMDKNKAAGICTMADRDSNGYITRNELCRSLHCWPDGQSMIQDVQILRSDMPEKKLESITWLICECARKRPRKGELVDEIKKRIEYVYGRNWNVFLSEGRIWSLYVHQPGSNLVFSYRGIVYGVYQSPFSD